MSDVADIHQLVHTLTWWQRTGAGGGGDPVFAAPVSIRGRWTENTRIFRSARDGAERTSRAVAPVDRDMAAGDYLKKGTSAAADPRKDGGLLIDGWMKMPSMDGERYIRRAFLI